MEWYGFNNFAVCFFLFFNSNYPGKMGETMQIQLETLNFKMRSEKNHFGLYYEKDCKSSMTRCWIFPTRSISDCKKKTVFPIWTHVKVKQIHFSFHRLFGCKSGWQRATRNESIFKCLNCGSNVLNLRMPVGIFHSHIRPFTFAPFSNNFKIQICFHVRCTCVYYFFSNFVVVFMVKWHFH